MATRCRLTSRSGSATRCSEILEAGGRDVANYQGNQTWVLPIPATFVVARDGRVTARFIDPDYRNRMTIEDLLAALKEALEGEREQKP